NVVPFPGTANPNFLRLSLRDLTSACRTPFFSTGVEKGDTLNSCTTTFSLSFSASFKLPRSDSLGSSKLSSTEASSTTSSTSSSSESVIFPSNSSSSETSILSSINSFSTSCPSLSVAPTVCGLKFNKEHINNNDNKVFPIF